MDTNIVMNNFTNYNPLSLNYYKLSQLVYVSATLQGKGLLSDFEKFCEITETVLTLPLLLLNTRIIE